MTTARPQCTGVLLAGGRALRMGGAPKGLERLGDARVMDAAVRALRDASEPVLLSANAADAEHWLPGSTLVRDSRPGSGAIGGILAALEACGHPVLTLPWDMPFVPGALLRALRDAGELHDSDAVVPTSDGPHGFEPLVGWFAPSCVPTLRAALEAGTPRAAAWLAQVRTMHLDSTPWGAPQRLFFNVNTPQDLDHARRLIAEAP